MERQDMQPARDPGLTGVACRVLDDHQCRDLGRLAAAARHMAGPLPPDLCGLRGSQARLPHHFDPNDLLPLFPAVRLDRAHRLDSLYWHDGRRVRALVYVRRRWGGPIFRTGEQYRLVLGTGGLPRLHHLDVTRTPAGVMQCLLLHEVLGRLHEDGEGGGRDSLVLGDAPGAAPAGGPLRPRVDLGERGAVVRAWRSSRGAGLCEVEYALDYGGRCRLLSCTPHP